LLSTGFAVVSSSGGTVTGWMADRSPVAQAQWYFRFASLFFFSVMACPSHRSAS